MAKKRRRWFRLRLRVVLVLVLLKETAEHGGGGGMSNTEQRRQRQQCQVRTGQVRSRGVVVSCRVGSGRLSSACRATSRVFVVTTV